MNIMVSAVNFGLGPVGKLSSIVNEVSNNIENVNWFAVGDKLDIAIFKKKIFKESYWSKDEEKIKKFINKNKIELAIVVLDPDIAIIVEKLGVPVFYVDSLPFLWTESDIVPFDVDMYFAQKCIDMNDRAMKIMDKVKNLKWINPIVPNINYKEIEYNKFKVVINLGGMHSPYGNGEEYIKLVLLNLLNELLEKYNMEEILVTCGSSANKAVKEILKKNNINNVKVKTLNQEEFQKTVIECELFITSPGMTTIYETCSYNKNTIILPPQNLSQFYNIEFAKKLIKRLKTINWDKYELDFKYLSKYLNLGEEKVVEMIYENIKKALEDDKYIVELRKNMRKTLKDNFKDRDIITYTENGTLQILNEIIRKEKKV